MEVPVKNKGLHDLVVQFASLQSERLSAASKNLIYKIWKELRTHNADFTTHAKSIIKPGIDEQNPEKEIEYLSQYNELAEQEITITFQPVDWNTITKDSEGRDRDLVNAYDFDEIGKFFTNYK